MGHGNLVTELGTMNIGQQIQLAGLHERPAVSHRIRHMGEPCARRNQPRSPVCRYPGRQQQAKQEQPQHERLPALRV